MRFKKEVRETLKEILGFQEAVLQMLEVISKRGSHRDLTIKELRELIQQQRRMIKDLHERLLARSLRELKETELPEGEEAWGPVAYVPEEDEDLAGEVFVGEGSA